MTARLAFAVSAAALIAAVGLAQAGDRRIRITNGTGATMVSLNASSSESGWSGDVLSGPIAPGKGALATISDGSGACVYDFTATLDDGSTRNAPGVNVCDLSVYAIQ